jgi:hypothetical protein
MNSPYSADPAKRRHSASSPLALAHQSFGTASLIDSLFGSVLGLDCEGSGRAEGALT